MMGEKSAVSSKSGRTFQEVILCEKRTDTDVTLACEGGKYLKHTKSKQNGQKECKWRDGERTENYAKTYERASENSVRS